MGTPARWVDQYSRSRERYVQFSAELEALLRSVLNAHAILFDKIESRAKGLDNFAEKLKRKEYHDPFQEMTDLVGCRIILYYAEDVERVCTIIDNTFLVNERQSVDKRQLLGTSQFGYLSVHKVVTLDSARSALPEWKRFEGLVAEIQVRTVLQHAWASISHALQYKTSQEVPETFARSMTRLAGLLELADEEFQRLKADERKFRRIVADRVSRGDLGVPIHLGSLSAYLETTAAGKELASAVAESGLRLQSVEQRDATQLLTVAQRLGLDTVAAVENELARLLPQARAFFENLVGLQQGKGASGPLSHWAATLVVGSRRATFGNPSHRSLGWTQSYYEGVIEAGILTFGDRA